MVTFSVVVPTHDDGSKVLDAIESIRAQTLRDFERIMVDDGSTDDTPASLRDGSFGPHRALNLAAERRPSPTPAGRG